jgi:CheY-like chemotaxis protein
MTESRCTVLVVEDDRDIRESLEDVLTAEGYRVITAENGRQGLERLRDQTDPCIILLDLMMPVMSGGEFLAELRANDVLATIPVVVVSAWPDEAAFVRAQAQGYVKKPVSLDVLLELVARYCSKERDARIARTRGSA